MMNSPRYILASNKVPKLDCPFCGAIKHWQRYVDTETGAILPEENGRCDNDQKCGQWVTPKDSGYAKMIRDQEQGITGITKITLSNKEIFQPKPKTTPVFFDLETFKTTLKPELYQSNVFIQNLLHRMRYPLDGKSVEKVIEIYRLGTVDKGSTAGAITFPFIDIKGNIRGVQEKYFDKFNHTDKTKKYHTSWTHARLKETTYKNKQKPEWLEEYLIHCKPASCLFGEHLLDINPNNSIALVEAPKTAIYGWLYFHKFHKTEDWLWLSVFNKSSFTFEKIKVLKGRTIYVFPDLSKDGSTFKEWKTKAMEFEKLLPGTKFIFSDLLEKLAPPELREEGGDLADVLTNMDWKIFREENKEEIPQKTIEMKETSAQKEYFQLIEEQPEIVLWNIRLGLCDPETNHPLKICIQDSEKTKLIVIAKKLFKAGADYSHIEIIETIKCEFKISKQRAYVALQKFFQLGILQLANSDDEFSFKSFFIHLTP